MPSITSTCNNDYRHVPSILAWDKENITHLTLVNVFYLPNQSAIFLLTSYIFIAVSRIGLLILSFQNITQWLTAPWSIFVRTCLHNHGGCLIYCLIPTDQQILVRFKVKTTAKEVLILVWIVQLTFIKSKILRILEVNHKISQSRARLSSLNFQGHEVEQHDTNKNP